jgi:hypothetical protein
MTSAEATREIWAMDLFCKECCRTAFLDIDSHFRCGSCGSMETVTGVELFDNPVLSCQLMERHPGMEIWLVETLNVANHFRIAHWARTRCLP